MRWAVRFAFTALVAVSGCGTPDGAIINASVVISAHREDGLPVSKVVINVNDVALGPTDDKGELRASLSGPDGALFRVSAGCPEGYDAPGNNPPIVLGRFASLTKKDGSLEVVVQCTRRNRAAAILVRTRVEKQKIVVSADKKARKQVAASEVPLVGVPVLINGRERARTDELGLAHLTLEAPPETHVEVVMQTGSEALASMRPRSPSQGLAVRQTDDVYTVDQLFTEEDLTYLRKIKVMKVEPTPKIKVLDAENTPALIRLKAKALPPPVGGKW
ncbi:MAG: hypothetical protein QOI66_2982 [Myxococcales bacterium]|jgi:hypothetical protein|nr:hypothetical protein [Myxococcales bacterium]